MNKIPQHIILQNVNYFNGATDSNCEKKVKIRSILKAIKGGKWKEGINYYRDRFKKEGKTKELEELKKVFPATTFSGTFNKTRHDKNLNNYTGILVIDIDKKDLAMNYQKTFECLKSTPFVFCAFMSTGGEGIKALAYTDDQSMDHKVFFRGVEEYLFEEYGIKIDPSGKNVGRLCFVSYDPDMYINFKDKECFSLKKFSPKTLLSIQSEKFEEVGRSSSQNDQFEASHNIKYIIDIAARWVQNSIGHYRKGNRNNFIFVVACILNRSGVPQYQAEQSIMGRYRSLGQKEVLATVNSAYTHNRHEHGSKPIRQKVKNNQHKIL